MTPSFYQSFQIPANKVTVLLILDVASYESIINLEIGHFV